HRLCGGAARGGLDREGARQPAMDSGLHRRRPERHGRNCGRNDARRTGQSASHRQDDAPQPDARTIQLLTKEIAMPIASSISEEAKLVDKILIWLALTFTGS